MKLCVVIPSDEYVERAGARIRYKRIEDNLQKVGVYLEFAVVKEITKINHDAYLFSKCFDTTALMVAKLASESGKLVGVDIFDDYFSQKDDTRFQAVRFWLDSSMKYLDFFLCATPYMKKLLENNPYEIPVHVMNDPCEPVDFEVVSKLTRKKIVAVGRNRVLDVVWFGMGDNPHFPVGLRDLVAFSGELRKIEDNGLKVNLEILTNSRALTVATLESLAKIPVSYRISIWSEVGEKALLNRSHVAFLPVSCQNFSIAKSLNRAITAVCAANQVLSAGFPLYDRMTPFVYRNAEDLCVDFSRGEPKLNPNTISDLGTVLKNTGDLNVETESLSNFLRNLFVLKKAENKNRKNNRSPVFLVQGVKSSKVKRALLRRAAIYTVSSPVSKMSPKSDIRFTWNESGDGLRLRVSMRAAQYLNPDVSSKGKRVLRLFKPSYLIFETSDIPLLKVSGFGLRLSRSPGALLLLHACLMPAILNILEYLFPEVQCEVSEQWQFPWLSPIEGQFCKRRNL